MARFCFGEFLKIMTKNLIPSMGQEATANHILKPLLNGRHIGKEDASKLKDQKISVWDDIIDLAGDQPHRDKLITYFKDTIKLHIEKEEAVINAICELLNADTAIPAKKRNELLAFSKKGAYSDFLAYTLLYSLSVENNIRKNASKTASNGNVKEAPFSCGNTLAEDIKNLGISIGESEGKLMLFYLPRRLYTLAADGTRQYIEEADVLNMEGIKVVIAPGGMGKSMFSAHLALGHGDACKLTSCLYLWNASSGDADAFLPQNRATYVFDALDELPSSHIKNSFLDMILQHTRNCTSNLLFSTRTKEDARLVANRFGCPVTEIYLDNFSMEDSRRFVANILGERASAFWKKIGDVAKIEEIITTPFFLDKLVCLFGADTLPTSKTSILESIIHETVDRENGLPTATHSDITQHFAVNNLETILTEFALTTFININETDSLGLLRSALVNAKFPATYDKTIYQFLHDRRFLVNGSFEHRLILEYLTAKAFFDKCNRFPLGIAPIKELFSHYNNPYWHNVIRLFLDIAEISLSTARLHTLYSAIIETGEIKDYTLLFDGLEKAEDAGLIKLLIKDILAKSINGQYPPYGPLFYYIPRYFLYGCLLEVLNEDFRGDARALALIRDVCFYGGATTIGEILDSIDGQALFFLAENQLFGTRRALCELFYTGSTQYEEGNNIYPRLFNVGEAQSLANNGAGLFTRAMVPFDDELHLYKHDSLNLLGGECIGLISLPYDGVLVEKELKKHSHDKVCGIVFTPTENCTLEYIDFTRINVSTLYIPENCTKLGDGWDRFMNLSTAIIVNQNGICYANKEGNIVLPEGVTHIPEKLFKGSALLESIILPATLQVIGGWSFYHCSRLKEIEIPNDVVIIKTAAFSNCYNLQSCKLPQGLCAVEGSAFRGDGNLSHISLPKSLRRLGWSTFSGCVSLEEITIPSGVSEISDGCFEGCYSLSKVAFDGHIVSIGRAAFAGCAIKQIALNEGLKELGERALQGTHITKISVPGSIKFLPSRVFANCEKLETVVIQEGVASINVEAFKGCRNIKEIRIPSTVNTFSITAFIGYGCKKLPDIYLPSHLAHLFPSCDSVHIYEVEMTPQQETHIADNALRGSTIEQYTVEDGAEVLGKYAFAQCEKLSSIFFPNSLLEIGDGCFQNCNKLSTISLPESTERIGAYAFAECSLSDIRFPQKIKKLSAGILSHSEVQSVQLPEKLAVILPSAFHYCYNLREIVFPPHLKGIGDKAFSHCTRLSHIDFSKCQELSIISHSVFSYCKSLKRILLPDSITTIGSACFESCRSLCDITLPHGMTEISSRLFKSCSSLLQIELPKAIKKIGIGAFQRCTNMKKVILPNSLATIEGDAFKGCSSLKHIILPANLTEIGASAFENCTSLEEIDIPNLVTTIGYRAFSGCKLKSVRISKNFENEIDEIFGDDVDQSIIKFY